MRFYKRLKWLLALLFFTSFLPPSPAQGEGGLIFKPYWAFRTDASVIHLQTGDINGDGLPEVVMTTTDNWVYVLENGGTLAWRYQVGDKPLNLLVADFDNDGRTSEIFVGSSLQDMLLSEEERPAWVTHYTDLSTFIANTAIDMNADGQLEIVDGYDIGIALLNSQTGKYHPKLAGPTIFRNSSQDLSQTSEYESNFDATTRPVIGVWAGELDGDGKPEIVPNLTGGFEIGVWEDDLALAWRKPFEQEIALVQPGDMNGDGLAEIAVVTATGELMLLKGDGDLIWQQPLLASSEAEPIPNPGQLLWQDLNGDGRQEIIILAAATVQAFDGAGQSLWQRQFQRTGQPTPALTEEEGVKVPNDIRYRRGGVLQPCPLDRQQTALLATIPGQTATHLLAADGQRLAEYQTGPTTGALACADLNNDDQPEIIIGTETGPQVFGFSAHVIPTVLWSSADLGVMQAELHLADLDTDGRDEIVAGSIRERVFVVGGDGKVLWDVSLARVGNLAVGDAAGDSQPEIVVGTWTGKDGGQIRVLVGRQIIWSVELGLRVTSVATWVQPASPQVKILAGVTLLDNSKAVFLLSGDGEKIWRYKMEEEITAISGDGNYVFVGDRKGRVYRLNAAGELVEKYDLGARVLGLEADLAATTEGKIYQLTDDAPILLHDFGETLTAVQLGPVIAAGFAGGCFSAIAAGATVWQGTVAGEITSIAMGDVNGDGDSEIALSTDDGRIHLFGLSFDQPLLLTNPLLAETRSGYTYSINANDPAGKATPVSLEIWDPSAGIWLPQPTQTLGEGQDQGRLTWQVAEPFDMWDSGQESRFRFSYDDGFARQTTPETLGPLNIPTTPWTIYYGQRLGLGLLILAVPVLGWVIYRRQQTYHRSPIGQAESLLKQLQATPHETLGKLHTLARTNSALLTYLPALASESGETAIADVSEGLHLLLIRPEVTAEDVRTVGEAAERLNGLPAERITTLTGLYRLFEHALAANTISRLILLQPSLNEWERRLSGLETENQNTLWPPTEITAALKSLSQVTQTLHNYQRVDAAEDKIAYLGQALELLGRLEREFRATLPQPEQNILARMAANWLSVVNNALQDVQGRAELQLALKTRQLVSFDEATLALELTNTGRSPASNISLALLPGPDYTTPGNGQAHLDILPAGHSTLLELPVAITPAAVQFRVEFNLTFDDRERNGKTLAFADRVQLLKPAAAFQPIPNPYAPGTPLRPGSALFFGREDLFQFIAENMGGPTRQNILVLIGQRRMGKTSFLQQLPARLGPDYVPVYLDGQSLGIDPGMANFFYDLSLTIADALAEQGFGLPEPALADFQERPSGAFERTFLPAVFELIGPRRLLCLFDEFEELEMRVASGKLEPTIFPYFRHLMQHSHKLGFIFVGTRRLEELSADYWSIFFNIALYKPVTLLGEGSARALIVEPVAAHGLLYDDLALDKMLRVTAGHPYFLQLTCHTLVNRANREGRGYLTIRDVNEAVVELVELGEAHFAFLWEQSSPSERLILAALMRLLAHTPVVTATQIAELLNERGVSLEMHDIRDALRRLVERDIIHEVAGPPPRYEYRVDLVRLWVERYQSLGRVIEELEK